MRIDHEDAENLAEKSLHRFAFVLGNQHFPLHQIARTFYSLEAVLLSSSNQKNEPANQCSRAAPTQPSRASASASSISCIVIKIATPHSEKAKVNNMNAMEEVVDLALTICTNSDVSLFICSLTLGLSWILVIMESVYVMTGREIYRDMTKFWGKLFAINFAMGVTSQALPWNFNSAPIGLTTPLCWRYFGTPLAIEGMMAFFLESSFVGLMFLAGSATVKQAHLAVTFLVAPGSNLSALWILIANGWMNNPVGAEFNYETMRMELTSISAVIFNRLHKSNSYIPWPQVMSRHRCLYSVFLRIIY